MLLLRFLLVLLFSCYGFCETYKELTVHLPDRPLFNGIMGKYLNEPGLAFEPNIDYGLIRFNKARASTYIPYIKRLDSILDEYVSMPYEHQMDCYYSHGYRPISEWGRNCRFDLMKLGQDCVSQQGYGYEDGQPCIALSLERVMNWLPEPYTNKTVPDKISDIWEEYSITVHCEPDDSVTKDNIGDILYYPPDGFHFKFFPNIGVHGWKSPLVFVRLDNPNPAVAVRITCSVYAKNIKHLNKFDTGKVTFDVMVD